MRHDTSKLLYFVYVHGDDYGAGSAAANDDDDDDEKGIKKKRSEKYTVLIPKVNSYCCRQSSAKYLGLKFHPKDYHQKLTN